MTKQTRVRFEPRRSLPIVEDIRVDPTDVDRGRLSRITARLVGEEPALSLFDFFGPGVSPGIGPGPAILFEDHGASAIGDRKNVSLLEYRTIFLAQEGDLFLVGEPRDLEFERYARSLLGLKRFDVDRPAAIPSRPTAGVGVLCALDPRIMARLVRMARESGDLTLITYMGSGSVWNLAREIAHASKATVHVASPHPRLSRRVNDKLWFGYRAAELFGRRAMPSTFAAFGPAGLAAHLKRLARDHEHVVLKVPHGSGSEGNLVLRTADFEGLPLSEVKARIVALMAELGWGAPYPLVVSVWETALLDSPSVQLWVPRREEGTPIVHGVFSQIVAEEAGEFVGAVPCELPSEWRNRLGREAAIMATLFQELGYFGPCSFDAVITGTDIDSAELHWLECNGRWTGVSIPLVLTNRLIGDWHDRPFVIVQRTGLHGARRASFGKILDLLFSKLFDPVRSSEGTVVLTPARVTEGTGIHIMVLAATVEAAMKESEAVSRLLLAENGEEAGDRRSAVSGSNSP